MSDIMLAGLGTRPLSKYLAAVGLFRILAEQADPGARAAWTPGGISLSTTLDRAALGRFLLDRYAPTPLVAPWNDKDQGGFHPGAAGRSADLLAAIAATKSARLAEYREVIDTTRRIVATEAWQQLAESKASKHALVLRLRNRLPDSVVRFIDAAVALTSDRAEFPPLLGTGANIGRLNLVTNYLEHLTLLMVENGTASGTREAWLAEVLDGTQTRGVEASPGQFDGHGVEAWNMARAGKAVKRTNPWMFVLSMEGAISFNATATVRLGTARRNVAAPYVVSATPAGYASAIAGEAGKGEFWAPVWSGRASWPELAGLIAEGRAIWRGRQATTGLDLLRAARTRGIDGGVRAFERYGIVVRSGQSPIAVHVGTVAVASDPQVALSGDLDGWRHRLGSSADTTAPAQIRSLRRRLDGALFELANRPDPLSARRLLGLVAQTERATARSGTFRRSAGDAAVPRLSTRWAQILDDGSVEFAVASRLAAGWESDRTVRHRCLAELLRPVRRNDHGDLVLDPAGPEVPGLGERPLCDVLADAAVRRAITGPAPSPDDQPAAIHGRWIQFPIAQPGSVLAQRGWVEALASEDLDERLLNEHLAACLLVHPQALGTYQPQAAQAGPARPSPVWRLLAPWFSRRPIPLDTQRGETAERPEAGVAGPPSVRDVFIPVVPPTWPGKLRHAAPGRSPQLLREVTAAYRAAGVDLAGSTQHVTLPPTTNAARWVLSALLVPTRVGDLRRHITPPTSRNLSIEPSQKETTHAR